MNVHLCRQLRPTIAIAIVGLFFVPANAATIVDLSLPATDFHFEREVDPGGGNNIYVLDWLKTAIAIPSTTIVSGTYHVHFTFDEMSKIIFDGRTQRIDVKTWFGPESSRYATTLVGSSNQATIEWQIDNLILTTFSADTQLFAAQYPAPPKGAGVNLWKYVSGQEVTPGSPFQLRSLDVTFNIPATWSLPTSPVTNLSLWIGGAGNFQTLDVPALPPLAAVVPDPDAVGMVLVAAAATFRRRWNPR